MCSDLNWDSLHQTPSTWCNHVLQDPTRTGWHHLTTNHTSNGHTHSMSPRGEATHHPSFLSDLSEFFLCSLCTSMEFLDPAGNHSGHCEQLPDRRAARHQVTLNMSTPILVLHSTLLLYINYVQHFGWWCHTLQYSKTLLLSNIYLKTWRNSYLKNLDPGVYDRWHRHWNQTSEGGQD